MHKTAKVGDKARIVSPATDPLSMSVGIGVYDPVTITKIEGELVTFTYIDANSGDEMQGECQLGFIKEVY